MNGIFKKSLVAFFISLAIFSLSALIIAGALSIGRGDPESDDVGKGGSSSTIEEGRSFSVLLIMTDYDPEQFDDYDARQIKNVFGDDAQLNASTDGFGRRINAEDMMLLRFDNERGELTFTPIPGNLLVTVKNIKMKLEVVAANYGMTTLVDKIRAIVGVEIDSYAVFTPNTAADLFDGIGEITYTVKSEMQLRDDSRGININISPGSQRFDGKKAVDFLRFDAYDKLSTTRTEATLGFLSRTIKKITEISNEKELQDFAKIMESKVSGSFFESIDQEQLAIISAADDLELKAIELWGEEQLIGDEIYFVFDETKTLETFKPYRRIYN